VSGPQNSAQTPERSRIQIIDIEVGCKTGSAITLRTLATVLQVDVGHSRHRRRTTWEPASSTSQSTRSPYREGQTSRYSPSRSRGYRRSLATALCTGDLQACEPMYTVSSLTRTCSMNTALQIPAPSHLAANRLQLLRPNRQPFLPAHDLN
jgi:hypothetical protein